MYTIIRTDSGHKDFRGLVKLLDQELAVIDGDEHAFYDQFNKIDSIKHVLILYDIDIPVSCGAIKEYDAQTMEIKRMYTKREVRGKGIASKTLLALEEWAVELGYKKCILETGVRQPDAIRLYFKNGYTSIENYGPYKEIANSRCFEKIVI